MTLPNIQSASIAAAATSAPVWAPLVDIMNPVLTMVLTGLGIVLTILKIKQALASKKVD